jgi:uncharacterized protein YecT (DUF1311 family)
MVLVRQTGSTGRSGLIGAAALCVALTACSNSGSPSGAPANPPSSSPNPSASSTGSANAASATGFVPIVEPFDPGHPARTKPSAPNCGSEQTTLAMEQCYEAQTESTDASIDAIQSDSYRNGSPSQQSAILAQDSAWLSARGPVCAKAYQNQGADGTIAGVGIASCLLDESTARLNDVKGINPPEEQLKATDNTDPSAFSWYTTPEGSRIGMAATQGDGKGGAIIAWVVIAGADGFLVNPSQFLFHDSKFTDHGTPLPPSPMGHRVAPLTEYQFEIDYSHLSSDPGAGSSQGGYLYEPGIPVANWD